MNIQTMQGHGGLNNPKGECLEQDKQGVSRSETESLGGCAMAVRLKWRLKTGADPRTTGRLTTLYDNNAAENGEPQLQNKRGNYLIFKELLNL